MGGDWAVEIGREFGPAHAQCKNVIRTAIKGADVGETCIKVPGHQIAFSLGVIRDAGECIQSLGFAICFPVESLVEQAVDCVLAPVVCLHRLVKGAATRYHGDVIDRIRVVPPTQFVASGVRLIGEFKHGRVGGFHPGKHTISDGQSYAIGGGGRFRAYRFTIHDGCGKSPVFIKIKTTEKARGCIRIAGAATGHIRLPTIRKAKG